MRKESQVIFITSESRSGSTFLSYMLGTNPRSAHLGEFFRPYKRSAKTSCRLCEAKGLDQCEIMGDLSTIPALGAHQHALDCFKKHGVHTLIDCSKDLDWIEETVAENKNNIDFKIIHLVRDPRGWIASERRRIKTMTVQAGIERWKNHFRSTSERIKKIEADSMKITYEEILLRKKIALEKLSSLLDFHKMPINTSIGAKNTTDLAGMGPHTIIFRNFQRISATQETICITSKIAKKLSTTQDGKQKVILMH